MLPGDPNDVAGPAPGVAPLPVAPAPVAPAVAVAPVAAPPVVQSPIAQAALKVGEAKGEASQAIADVEKEAAAQNTQLVEREARMQAEHAAAMRQANQETADAFKKAREMEPTGFWEGRGGREVHSAIAVGLGRVAQVLGHMANNSTADIVQSNIDRHYREEKDKIDRAFQYATQQGKLTGEMRDQYAQELLALQAARNATTAASAEKIRAITAASQSKIDKAQAELDAQKLEKNAADGLLKDAEVRANILKTKAQTARDYAGIAAEKQRIQIAADEEARKQAADAAKAEKDKTKAQAGSEKEFERRARDFEQKILEGTSKSPGPMQLHRQLSALQGEIENAIKSGDKERAMAAVLTIEQGSRALSGAAPTKTSTHLITETQSLGDIIQQKWGQLTGNPTASKAFLARLKTMVEMGKREKVEIANAAIKDFETKELDPNTGISVGTPVEGYARKRIEGFKKGSQSTGAATQGVPVSVKLKSGEVVKGLKFPDGHIERAQ